MPSANPPKHNAKRLHRHPKMEATLGVPQDHVIIDRDVYEGLLDTHSPHLRSIPAVSQEVQDEDSPEEPT
jgi:hypothetical protein